MGRLISRFRRCVAACALMLAPAISAQSLQVTRADGSATTLTAAQIAALPHVSVNVQDHDTPAEFDGVPLSAVLALGRRRAGGKMKGPQLTQALLIEACRRLQGCVRAGGARPGVRDVARYCWPTNETASRSTPSRAPSALWLPATNARHAGFGKSQRSKSHLVK